MLLPEGAELEQHSDVHKAEEGNADTASDGGLKKNNIAMTPERMLRLSARKRWVVTCPYSFTAQMITSTAQLRWRTQKYSVL